MVIHVTKKFFTRQNPSNPVKILLFFMGKNLQDSRKKKFSSSKNIHKQPKMSLTKLCDNLFSFDGILIHFNDQEPFKSRAICSGSTAMKREKFYREFEHLVTKSTYEFLKKYNHKNITDPEAQKIFEHVPETLYAVTISFGNNKKRHIEFGKVSYHTTSFEVTEANNKWINSLNSSEAVDLTRQISYFNDFIKIPNSRMAALENRVIHTEDVAFSEFCSDFKSIMQAKTYNFRDENLLLKLPTLSNNSQEGYFKTVQDETLNSYLRKVLPSIYGFYKETSKFKHETFTAGDLDELITEMVVNYEAYNPETAHPDCLNKTLFHIASIMCNDDDAVPLSYSTCTSLIDSLSYILKLYSTFSQKTMTHLVSANSAYRDLKHARSVVSDMNKSQLNVTQVYMRSNGDIVCLSNTKIKVVQLRSLVETLDRKIKEPPIDPDIFDIDVFYREVFIPYEAWVRSTEAVYEIDDKSHMITDLGERASVYCANLRKVVDKCTNHKDLKTYAENLLRYAMLTTYFFTDGNMRASQVKSLKIGGMNKNFFMNPSMLCIVDDYSKSGKDNNRGKQSMNVLLDGAAYKAIYCLVTAKSLLLHIFDKEFADHPEEYTHGVVLDNSNKTVVSADQKRKHLMNFAFSKYDGRLLDMDDILKGLQKNTVDESRIVPSVFRQCKAFIQKLLISYDMDGNDKYQADRETWERLIAHKNGHSRQTFLTLYGTHGLDPKRFGATQMSHYAALGIALFLGPTFIDDYWSDTLDAKHIEEIKQNRNEIQSRYCTHLNFCMADVMLLNRKLETSAERSLDRFAVTLGDILGSVKVRHKEMKVMLQAMFSSINQREMLFFECSTGSGKTHTVIEYMKAILDKTYHTCFLYIVPYGSLLADVKSDMEKRGLRVGGIEELNNKEQRGVFVLKYNDIAGKKIHKIQYICHKWNVDIKQIFFDEAHILLTDNDYRDCIQFFPSIPEFAECYSIVMLSATLGGLADDIACWMGFELPTYYGPRYNKYEAGKPQVVHALTRNIPKYGVSSYYKLVDKSILDRVPLARFNISRTFKLPKAVLSMININLKGLVFMATKTEVNKMATIMASIFGLKAVAVITGESKVEYLNECLADPDVKIFIGTTSCTTGLNLGIQYVILAAVPHDICNVLQTYQLLGRIREEAFHEDSFIVEITTNETKSNSLLTILQKEFKNLTTRAFPCVILDVAFDYKKTDHITLLETRIYNSEMDWKTGRNLRDDGDDNAGVFTSCIKDLIATNTHIPIFFGGIHYIPENPAPIRRRTVSLLEDNNGRVELFDGFTEALDNRIGDKDYLARITEDKVNDQYPVWFKMTGYITGMDVGTGYFGFVDGSSPTAIMRNFAEVVNETDPNGVALTNAQNYGVGILRSIGSVRIPVDFTVCLDIAANNSESRIACANYHDCQPVTVMGSLCKTDYYEEDEESINSLVFREVIVWKSAYVPEDIDLSFDLEPLGYDDEEFEDEITQLKNIRTLGSYKVKGILVEPKKHSCFLFYDGTVKRTLLNKVPWKVSNFPTIKHGSTTLNTFYTVPVSKEKIMHEDVDYGTKEIPFGTKFPVLMNVTVVKRYGALYLSECKVLEMYEM